MSPTTPMNECREASAAAKSALKTLEAIKLQANRGGVIPTLVDSVAKDLTVVVDRFRKLAQRFAMIDLIADGRPDVDAYIEKYWEKAAEKYEVSKLN